MVKPPKPPPKIQQLHYCDVCKISCAGRSNFPLWKFAFRLSNFYPTASASKLHELVMGRDRNLREKSLNVKKLITIFWNHEICERQFSLSFVILSEIAEITGIGCELDFTI